MLGHEPIWDRDGKECRFCGKAWRLCRTQERCPRRSDDKPDDKPDVSMEVATHSGKRLRVRGVCEKCGTPTNWVVTSAGGRTGAYWCGC